MNAKSDTGNKHILINADNIICIYTGGILEAYKTIYVDTVDGRTTKVGVYKNEERVEAIYKSLVEEISANMKTPGYILEVTEK